MNKNLQQLLQHQTIWRLGDAPRITYEGIKTGFEKLDAELPGHGWPQGALTELLYDQHGIGEISLVAPTLRQLSQEGRNIFIIAPPFLPFVRALDMHNIKRDRLLIVETDKTHLTWVTEQVIKSVTNSMVLLWDHTKQLDYTQLRRLHLAAEKTNTVCILYRALATQHTPSAAVLRIALCNEHGNLCARIIKRKGSLASKLIRLSLYPSYWREETIRPEETASNNKIFSHLVAGQVE